MAEWSSGQVCEGRLPPAQCSFPEKFKFDPSNPLHVVQVEAIKFKSVNQNNCQHQAQQKSVGRRVSACHLSSTGPGLIAVQYGSTVVLICFTCPTITNSKKKSRGKIGAGRKVEIVYGVPQFYRKPQRPPSRGHLRRKHKKHVQP